MKELLLLFAIVLGLLPNIKSQQDYQLTHFMFDRLSFNPGVAGINGMYCGTLISRQQWAGFEGSPQTGLLNAQMPLDKINSGAGLTVAFDHLGQQQSVAVRGTYSYHLRNIAGGKLGIGLSFGYFAKYYGNNWIAVDNPLFDNAIPNSELNGGILDFNFGLYYHHKNGAYAGISTTHINEASMENVFSSTDISTGNLNEIDFSEVQSRHYYLMGGYAYKIGSNPNSQIRSNVLVKSDGAATQVDVNINYLYNNTLWGGVTYRIEDAIAPMVGYQKSLSENDMLKVGYSYDVTTSQLSSYSNGSHEVFVNYCFTIVSPPNIQKYLNPRFL